jgi:serine/threonine-protein kinase
VPATTLRTATGPTALVLLAISPWGEVYVDGKSMGVSPPLAELELAPGRHRIEVRNGGFKPYQEDVQLGSNETVRIKHKFTYAR